MGEKRLFILRTSLSVRGGLEKRFFVGRWSYKTFLSCEKVVLQKVFRGGVVSEMFLHGGGLRKGL